MPSWTNFTLMASSSGILPICTRTPRICLVRETTSLSRGSQDTDGCPGNWFKQNPGKREHIFLATKFANKVNPDGSRGVDSSPEYARSACEKSLKRLGLSHIDLYYAHRLDGKTPVEKTVEELKKLKQEGKIKYIGLSECSSDSLRRACKVEHIDAIQIE